MTATYQNIPQNSRKIIQSSVNMSKFDITMSVIHKWQVGYFEHKPCLYNAKTIFMLKETMFPK